jgi:hypothetical protein
MAPRRNRRNTGSTFGQALAGAIAQDPNGFLTMFGGGVAQNDAKTNPRPTEKRVGVLSVLEVAQLMQVVETEQSSDWFVDDQSGRVSQWRIQEGEAAEKYGTFLLVRAIPTEEDKARHRAQREKEQAKPDERDEKIAALESQLGEVLELLRAQVAPEASAENSEQETASAE